MLATDWIRSAQKSGWRVSAVSAHEIRLVCSCIGCDGRMTLPLDNLGSPAAPCDRPHRAGHGAKAFANYETMIDELRRRRLSLGLDQQDVTTAMGMADGYIAKLESYAKIASPPTLLLWAQTLGLTFTTSPTALPPATIKAIDNRRTKPYAAGQARFKHAG